MFLNGQSRVALYWGILLSAALVGAPAQAANITIGGVISTDDAVQLFDLTVADPAIVDLRSYGYAGGVIHDDSGITVVPSGGFDTILTLFSASGVLLNENDDGIGVPVDPRTGLAADARITMPLATGNYIVAVSQFDNFVAATNLSSGFLESGNPNFTADPGFASGGACPGGMFRDLSGTPARCRTGNWTVDFINVATASPIPEPAAALLFGVGLLGFIALQCVHRKRRRIVSIVFLLTAAGAAIAFGQEAENDSVLHAQAFAENPSLMAQPGTIVVLDAPGPDANRIRYQLSGGRHEFCLSGNRSDFKGLVLQDDLGQQLLQISGRKFTRIDLQSGIYTLQLPPASAGDRDASRIAYLSVDPLSAPLTDATGDAVGGFWAVQPDPDHDPDPKHRDGRLRSLPQPDGNQPPFGYMGEFLVSATGTAVIADYSGPAIDQYALFRFRYGGLPNLAPYYPANAVLDVFRLDPGTQLPGVDFGAMLIAPYACPGTEPYTCWLQRSPLRIQDLGHSQFQFQFKGRPFHYFGYYPQGSDTSYPNLSSNYFYREVPGGEPIPPVTNETGPFRLIFRFFDDGNVGQLQQGEVALFEGCGYQGRAIVLGAATAKLLEWNSETVSLDKLGKSIRLGNNTAVTLYPNAGFAGPPVTVRTDQTCLAQPAVAASVQTQLLAPSLATAPDCPNCKLNGADLTGFNLTGGDLSGAQLKNAILTNVKLNGAKLSGTDFTDATLSCTDFSGSGAANPADLTSAIFTNVKVTSQQDCRPNFSYTVLEAKLLPLQALRFLDLSGVKISHLKGNPLSSAARPLNLTGALLQDASLDGIILPNADLTEAVLNRASLQGANFANAKLYGAQLNNVNLDGANLGGAF